MIAQRHNFVPVVVERDGNPQHAWIGNMVAHGSGQGALVQLHHELLDRPRLAATGTAHGDKHRLSFCRAVLDLNGVEGGRGLVCDVEPEQPKRRRPRDVLEDRNAAAIGHGAFLCLEAGFVHRPRLADFGEDRPDRGLLLAACSRSLNDVATICQCGGSSEA